MIVWQPPFYEPRRQEAASWAGAGPARRTLVRDLVDEIVLSGWLGEAEFEHDPCSARSGGGRFDPDVSAHRDHEFADDVQAESAAADAVAHCWIKALELV